MEIYTYDKNEYKGLDYADVDDADVDDADVDDADVDDAACFFARVRLTCSQKAFRVTLLRVTGSFFRKRLQMPGLMRVG